MQEAINWLLRAKQEPSPGFDVELVALLNDGTRISDARYTTRHFKTFTVVRDGCPAAAEPSREHVERGALEQLDKAPLGRWYGLIRSLTDIGIETSADDLDRLPEEVVLDGLAEHLTID